MSYNESSVSCDRRAIINNKIVSYDVCAKDKHVYDVKHYRYIGTGKIYKINGIEQSGEEELHFFNRKE